MKSGTQVLLAILIILGAMALFAGLMALRTTPPAETLDEKAWTVRVVEITPGVEQPVQEVFGYLESPRSATLSAAVRADVLETPAREGQMVAQGETLIRLDDVELRLLADQRRAQVAELEAQLELERQRVDYDRQALANEDRLLALAEAERKRVESLVARNLTSQSSLDSASQAYERQQLSWLARKQSVDGAQARLDQLEARLRQARSLLEQAELDLARATVTAPFDGRIARVHVAEGRRVQPGEPLLEMYDTSRLEVRATIPGRHLPAVQQALAAGETIRAEGESDGVPLRLTLRSLAGAAQPGSAGVNGLFRVEGQPTALPLGRFVSLRMQLPPVSDVVRLPFEAMYGTDRVYRLRDGRMHGVSVTQVGQVRGENGETLVLVKSEGLSAGDRVIATQLPRAMDGLLVRVADDQGSMGQAGATR